MLTDMKDDFARSQQTDHLAHQKMSSMYKKKRREIERKMLVLCRDQSHTLLENIRRR